MPLGYYNIAKIKDSKTNYRVIQSRLCSVLLMHLVKAMWKEVDVFLLTAQLWCVSLN